jgi:hypothetical protein
MPQASYLDAFGYNESPDELGGPTGFWRFASYEALEFAYQTSTSLDEVFQELGLVTYSKIVWVIDQKGNAVFHLLVLSARDDLYLRQYDLMEQAVGWLKTQRQSNLNVQSLGIAGIQCEALEKRKQDHGIHLNHLKRLSQRREQCTKILRFLNSDRGG